jgi:hypothetical protein
VCFKEGTLTLVESLRIFLRNPKPSLEVPEKTFNKKKSTP